MQEEEKDVSSEAEAAEGTHRSSRRSRLYSKMPFISKLSFSVFLLTVLLVPLIFLPGSFGLQLEFVKKVIFSVGILASLGLWLLTRLEDGKLNFPGGAIIWSSLLICISFIVSALVSGTPGLALTGLGYENDTLLAIVLFFSAMFLAASLFDSKKRIFKFFYGLASVSLIIGAVELLQIFSPLKLAGTGVLDNPIGRWNDLGVFFGLSLLMSLVAVEIPHHANGRQNKSWTWLLMALSFIMVALVNYDMIWAVVAAFSLVIFIYSLTRRGVSSPEAEEEGPRRRRSGGLKNIIYKPSLWLLVVSVLFYIGSGPVGSMLGKYGIYQLEVRPSFQSTVDVAKAGMQKSLYFGTGPNTFSADWSMYKPDAVNSTIFWHTDFNVGFGRVISYGATLGLLGLVASGLFLLTLAYYGYKAIVASFDDPAEQYVIMTSCIASFYLWTFSVLYITDTALLSLTFVVTGIFLAALIDAGIVKRHGLSFLNSPKLGFLSVLLIVVLIISVASVSYMLFRKFDALYNFQQGLYNFNQSGNLDSAEQSLKNAISMDEQDLYYRSLTEIGLIRLKNLIAGNVNLPKDQLFQQLQNDLTSTAGSARRATELNPNNYQNWVSLGDVGQTVMPIRNIISGSYELAIASYSKASGLNSKDPSIFYDLAQVEVANGNLNKAKDYLNQALQRKSNYTEVLFLLSQIEARQGNLASAIDKSEQAASFSPSDVGILFQLGLLKYMNKDYTGAAQALKAATNVQSNYANAMYFLGLSESKLGDYQDAISEFEGVLALNPDSKEVQNILVNLKAGRGALDNIVPPKNEPVAPEKRSKLPVKEKPKKEIPITSDPAETNTVGN